MDKFFLTPKRLYTTRQGGYITLLSVLVVGAIGITITVALLLLGLGASRTSFAREESAQARALADACAEEALKEIRDAALCAGGGTMTFPRGVCTSTVVGDGSLCVLESTGTVADTVRRTRVILSAVGPLVISTSWREVADF